MKSTIIIRFFYYLFIYILYICIISLKYKKKYRIAFLSESYKLPAVPSWNSRGLRSLLGKPDKSHKNPINKCKIAEKRVEFDSHFKYYLVTPILCAHVILSVLCCV